MSFIRRMISGRDWPNSRAQRASGAVTATVPSASSVTVVRRATGPPNRRARFYAITAAGRRRLAAQTEDWERIAGVMTRLLGLSSDP